MDNSGPSRRRKLMTEEQWLACIDSLEMLQYMNGHGSDRKFRLFACACCRRIWDLFPDPANRHLVAFVEDHPDGKCRSNFFCETHPQGEAPSPELSAAIVASSARESEFGDKRAYWAAKHLGRGFYKMSTAHSAIAVALWASLAIAKAPEQRSLERRHQTDLIRCIFGNRVRPATLDPHWLAWNDDKVRLIADGIYNERAFDRLPILADALEDAGCSDADILNHCRQGGEHVRGCYVVDLLLGKD
jgi:hypothetical protein